MAPRHQPTHNALSRLNLVATRAEVEVAGPPVERWRILQSGDLFVAANDGIQGLRVPLEMLGRGQPRLMSWQRQQGLYTGFGLLRFSVGRTEATGAAGEDLETTAIIDLNSASIVGMPLTRRGTREAKFEWEDATLRVNAADGVVEEFTLKGIKVTTSLAGAGRTGESRPRPASVQAGTPAWAPWSQPGQFGGQPQRQASRPPKQKSFFEMLFGN
jgi:hypothetical protein